MEKERDTVHYLVHLERDRDTAQYLVHLQLLP